MRQRKSKLLNLLSNRQKLRRRKVCRKSSRGSLQTIRKRKKNYRILSRYKKSRLNRKKSSKRMNLHLKLLLILRETRKLVERKLRSDKLKK